MKISNETKIGALTAIAITVLILGFNFLKGRNLTEHRETIYSVFPDIKGLQVSNAVIIKGLQVGKISEMHETDNNLTGILVSITLNKNINIPKNSMAIINSDLLGSASLEIRMGNGTDYVKTGDTLKSTEKLGIMTEITNTLSPALTNVNKTLNSLDVLINQLSAILDPKTQGNLQSTIASLSNTSRELEKLIAAQSAVVGKTISNVEAITGTFAKNSGKLDTTISNLAKMSDNLARADLAKTVESVNGTVNKLQQLLNSKTGTVGSLLNDRQLYDEIRMTNRSLTTLLDDVRVNPKRYVNISVFGRKNKSGPILQPIIYDTIPKK